MANFREGQRVRMVRPSRLRNLGKTGVIREIWRYEQEGDRGYANCSVDWDSGEIDGGEWDDGYATHTDQLEPLTPPHEACDDAEFIASLDRLVAKVEEMA